MRSWRSVLLAAAGLSVVAGVTACSTSTAPRPTTTTTAVVTATAVPAPSTTPSAPATTPVSPASTAPASTPPASASTGTTRCTTAQLRGDVVPGSGGGAAGTSVVDLRLTSAGPVDCTLQGWPGTSLVGGGNGAQVGAAADFDRTTPHPTVTLRPGGATEFQVRVANAANYPSSRCRPERADGFRVYPPGQTASLFTRDADYEGCRATDVHLVTVGALR